MDILLQILIPVIGTVLTVVAVALAKKGLDLLGVKRSKEIDALIDKYVNKGIVVAEVTARQYVDTKMSGGAKKQKALEVAKRELEAAGIKDVAEDLLADRIEGWLELQGHEPGKASESA